MEWRLAFLINLPLLDAAAVEQSRSDRQLESEMHSSRPRSFLLLRRQLKFARVQRTLSANNHTCNIDTVRLYIFRIFASLGVCHCRSLPHISPTCASRILSGENRDRHSKTLLCSSV